MRSIKWCQFQWPRTNPNPVFKVTPLFDAKYLTNGYRYGHSYYRRRIGYRTQAVEWHQFQWSRVTSNPISRSRYYSTSNSSKIYKIKLYLQWPTNIESRILWSIERRHFQWSWTTPNLVFKVTPFFDIEYLTNGYSHGHSYYKRRIGNRTQAFEWYQLQWHRVTSNPDFKVAILFNVK